MSMLKRSAFAGLIASLTMHAAQAQPQYRVGVLTQSGGTATHNGDYNSGADALIQLDGDPNTAGLQPVSGFWEITIADPTASTGVSPSASASALAGGPPMHRLSTRSHALRVSAESGQVQCERRAWSEATG